MRIEDLYTKVAFFCMNCMNLILEVSHYFNIKLAVSFEIKKHNNLFNSNLGVNRILNYLYSFVYFQNPKHLKWSKVITKDVYDFW